MSPSVPEKDYLGLNSAVEPWFNSMFKALGSTPESRKLIAAGGLTGDPPLSLTGEITRPVVRGNCESINSVLYWTPGEFYFPFE